MKAAIWALFATALLSIQTFAIFIIMGALVGDCEKWKGSDLLKYFMAKTGGQSKGLNFLKLSDDRDVWRGMAANVCSRSGTWWWWWWWWQKQKYTATVWDRSDYGYTRISRGKKKTNLSQGYLYVSCSPFVNHGCEVNHCICTYFQKLDPTYSKTLVECKSTLLLLSPGLFHVSLQNCEL